MEKFKELIYNQHDVVCNQKYANILPYSFHLKCVEAQGDRFLHLIEDKLITNEKNASAWSFSLKSLVQLALSGHDLIEDGRLTYNDLVKIGEDCFKNYYGGYMFANIVYAVTDEKGKTRAERKSDKYYKELFANKLAVFVKLADISANTLFSKLTGSYMYGKYKSEFAHFKEMCYLEEYKEFFDYLETI
jgi:hypothetical protein